MTDQRPYVSVIDPIGPAIERVKIILFRPFDLVRWFIIGFCAWLAYMGTGGANFRFSQRQHYTDAHQFFQQTKDFVIDNLPWVILISVIVVILTIAVWVLVTWLSSRGRFMFLHCVARNEAEVRVPWTKFRQHANSLFVFRLVLSLINLVVAILLCLPLLFLIIAVCGSGLNMTTLFSIMMILLLIIVISIVFSLAHKFTTDFVVPIMFLRTASCITAWREFWPLLSTNKARFALYILFQIAISIAIVAILAMAACITCCIAACCLMIPYIGTVLMLPLLVFKRSYSLLYLRQFGPAFDVFSFEITTP